MSQALRPVEVFRVQRSVRTSGSDVAATEEPMEIRLHGEPFAVIMRTPGADKELTAGFLLAERVVLTSDDLGTIEHCVNPERPELRNVINVTLVNRDFHERLNERRRVMMNSSCGLCGRLTLESLRAEAPSITADWTLGADVVTELATRLRESQAVFDETGGLHAAGLFDREGRLEVLAEDVGRHNAVDKVIGRMLLRDALPLENRALVVSGRASFEIVQKAFLAGIPIVAAVSAPSSLAVELADEVGITLLGFVRGETFNIYTHPGRIT